MPLEERKEELQKRAQLVRIHESNCQMEYPDDLERNFRHATMKALAKELGFAELKQATITGNAKGVQRPLNRT